MLMCLIIPPNPPVTLGDVLTMKARGLEPTMLEVSRISHFTCAKNKKRLCHFCCHVRASSGIDANWHVVRHCFWLRLSYLKIELDPSLHCRCNEFKSRIELESNWASYVSLKATIAFLWDKLNPELSYFSVRREHLENTRPDGETNKSAIS